MTPAQRIELTQAARRALGARDIARQQASFVAWREYDRALRDFHQLAKPSVVLELLGEAENPGIRAAEVIAMRGTAF